MMKIDGKRGEIMRMQTYVMRLFTLSIGHDKTLANLENFLSSLMFCLSVPYAWFRTYRNPSHFLRSDARKLNGFRSI